MLPEDMANDGDYKSYIDKPATIMLQYLLEITVMLAVVLIAKHMHGRPRPVVHPPAKRMVDLRTKETNCSFPSGDAAQGALFAFFLAYHYPYLYIALQEWVFILKFVAMVSIGRVFHHCHYFGDTLFGAFLGYLVAAGFWYGGFTVDAYVPNEWN